MLQKEPPCCRSEKQFDYENYGIPPLTEFPPFTLVTDKRMECFSQIPVRGKDIIKNSSMGTRYCYQLP